MTYKIDIDEFEKRAKKLAKQIRKNKDIINIYGAPRGGLIPAVRISYLTGLPVTELPNKDTTAIINDCYELGLDMTNYKDFKNIFYLVDKEEEEIKEDIEFWWE